MSKKNVQANPELCKAWEDLVISMLSVNRYSMEKTYSLIESLRKEGLVEPLNLFKWRIAEIANRLKIAGYDRGEFMTNLFASRLADLGKLFNSIGVDRCRQTILSKDRKEIEVFLRKIKGVGPTVLSNFYVLQNIK